MPSLGGIRGTACFSSDSRTLGIHANGIPTCHNHTCLLFMYRRSGRFATPQVRDSILGEGRCQPEDPSWCSQF